MRVIVDVDATIMGFRQPRHPRCSALAYKDPYGGSINIPPPFLERPDQIFAQQSDQDYSIGT